MNVTFRLDQRALQRFLSKLDKTNVAVMHEADRGLNMEAEFIKTDAQEQTPVNFGTLQGSALVTRLKQLAYEVKFGGAAKKYALYVHENMTARHKTGNAKFLENAMKSGLRGMTRRLAKRLEKVMR